MVSVAAGKWNIQNALLVTFKLEGLRLVPDKWIEINRPFDRCHAVFFRFDYMKAIADEGENHNELNGRSSSPEADNWNQHGDRCTRWSFIICDNVNQFYLNGPIGYEGKLRYCL